MSHWKADQQFIPENEKNIFKNVFKSDFLMCKLLTHKTLWLSHFNIYWRILPLELYNIFYYNLHSMLLAENIFFKNNGGYD